jgi:hypothetical protein
MLRHGKAGVWEKVDMFAFSNIAEVSADGYAFPILAVEERDQHGMCAVDEPDPRFNPLFDFRRQFLLSGHRENYNVCHGSRARCDIANLRDRQDVEAPKVLVEVAVAGHLTDQLFVEAFAAFSRREVFLNKNHFQIRLFPRARGGPELSCKRGSHTSYFASRLDVEQLGALREALSYLYDSARKIS